MMAAIAALLAAAAVMALVWAYQRGWYRPQRGAWHRHRATLKEYEVRLLARTLFRRWRPVPRLSHLTEGVARRTTFARRGRRWRAG